MVQERKPLCSGVTVPKSVSVSSRVDCKCGTHLHLPAGNLVRAISHMEEDAIELRWQHVYICQVWVRGGPWEEEVANNLDTEELLNF